ncbi:MAG TPA: xanthine dehydrogenase family protein subunit M [Blastocatellia bacterium]|nr:xanthine dehydrogenase family protein subunit M [Blastocatellia bacterium]
MRAFEYANPATKEQAVNLLGTSWADAEVLAGGTDLLSLMKDDVVMPKRLVNLKEIAELRGINQARLTGSKARAGLSIGALSTIQDLVDNAQLRSRFPALVQAAEGITSPQIRSMGTVGGDLCQRPRCWYYRAGYGLLARDESGGSLVTGGDNRYHAILGNAGPAYFVNPSSLAPALIAFDAQVEIYGPKGKRVVPVEKFFVSPQSESEREYDLKPNEIVTRIILPSAGGAKSATYEVRQKEALDWPLAAASVALTINSGKVTAARIVMGHVAPVPWRSKEAEAALVGKNITEATAKTAGDAAVTGAKSLSGNGYKIQLARVAVKRAILQAAKGGVR